MACDRLTPTSPLVGSALWACIEGEGEEQIMTRRGEIVTGRVIRLIHAPRTAHIGRKLHVCKETSDE